MADLGTLVVVIQGGVCEDGRVRFVDTAGFVADAAWGRWSSARSTASPSRSTGLIMPSPRLGSSRPPIGGTRPAVYSAC